MKELSGESSRQSEVNLQHEGVEVPKNWKFLERNKAGLMIKQLDLHRRLLAFDLPDSNDVRYRSQYCDYIFNRDGSLADSRKHFANYTQIKLMEGDTQMNFSLTERNGRLRLDNPVLSEFEKEGIGSMILARANFGLNPDDENDKNNYLSEVNLGNIFGRDEKGSVIESSNASIINIAYLKPNSTSIFEPNRYYTWMLSCDSGLETAIRESNRQANFFQVVLRDKKKGSNIFGLRYGVGDDGVMVIEEAHLPTQTTKILRIHTSLDMFRIGEVAYARPRYYQEATEEDEARRAGKSLIKWKNINDEIGLRLAYFRRGLQKS